MWKTQPKAFGGMHIFALIFMVACLVVGAILGKKFQGEQNRRKRDKALTILGFIIIGLETFKLIFKGIVGEDVDLRMISFQICSIPMYLLPWIYFMKEGKLKKSFIGYVAFQCFVSAFFFFVKPVAILTTKYVILSIHSMIWHSLLVGIAVFTMVGYDLLNKKGRSYVILGDLLWILTAFIAMILDVILRNAVPGTLVDLFYIAPGSTFKYPLLSIFFPKPEPYPLYFFCFLVYYTLGAFIIYWLGCGLTALANRSKAKKA